MRATLSLLLIGIPATLVAQSSSHSSDWARAVYDLSADNIERSAASGCEELIPESLSLQVACRKAYRKGAVEFLDVAGRAISEPRLRRALRGCWDLFTEGGRTDFSLLGACARREEEALAELNNGGPVH